MCVCVCVCVYQCLFYLFIFLGNCLGIELALSGWPDSKKTSYKSGVLQFIQHDQILTAK